VVVKSLNWALVLLDINQVPATAHWWLIVAGVVEGSTLLGPLIFGMGFLVARASDRAAPVLFHGPRLHLATLMEASEEVVLQIMRVYATP